MTKQLATAFIALLMAFTGLSQVQDIPQELLQRYRSRLEAEPRVPVHTGQRYETPQIQVVDSLDDVPEKVPIERLRKEREVGTFTDYIIVGDDTLQAVEKALPEELDRFGSGLFDLRSTTRPVLAGLFSDDYILGAGDKIVVNIWGDANYQYDLTIDAQGKVFIPVAGEIHLSGMSYGRAVKEIEDFLMSIYSNVNISITPGQIKTINVYVLGDVHFPGSYPMSGLSTVLNALDFGGGPSETGSWRDVRVVRGGNVVARFDIYRLLTEGVAPGNINLSTNDIIFVPENRGMVKLRGAVLRPAKYETKDDMTFEELIQLAGGFYPDANINSILVDRVQDQRRVILTLDYSNPEHRKEVIRHQDDISVFTISPIRDDVVFVEGHVVNRGAYHLKPKTTFSEFVDRNHLILEDTYQRSVNIVRERADFSKEILQVDLEAIRSGDLSGDIELRRNDVLYFFSKRTFLTRRTVDIRGMVRNPGSYDYFENMLVSDLIIFAGGLRDEALLNRGEISRVHGDRENIMLEFNPLAALEQRGYDSDVRLEPDDFVFIRENPDWMTQRIVEIEGEVLFPGSYALKDEEETISMLLDRAGGFTNQAFRRGTVLEREDISRDMQRRNITNILEKTIPASADTAGILIQDKRDFTSLNRVIIDMDRATKGDMREDIILQDGDYIYVPPTPSGVSIKGAVAFEGTINYVEGRNLRYYINRAGGFLKDADSREVRVVKYNGMTLKVGLRYKGIEPGDLVVVPSKEREEKNVMRIIMDTVSILSGLATTIYILIKL